VNYESGIKNAGGRGARIWSGGYERLCVCRFHIHAHVRVSSQCMCVCVRIQLAEPSNIGQDSGPLPAPKISKMYWSPVSVRYISKKSRLIRSRSLVLLIARSPLDVFVPSGPAGSGCSFPRPSLAPARRPSGPSPCCADGLRVRRRASSAGVYTTVRAGRAYYTSHRAGWAIVNNVKRTAADVPLSLFLFHVYDMVRSELPAGTGHV
jgi:hypothetical protein